MLKSLGLMARTLPVVNCECVPVLGDFAAQEIAWRPRHTQQMQTARSVDCFAALFLTMTPLTMSRHSRDVVLGLADIPHVLDLSAASLPVQEETEFGITLRLLLDPDAALGD